MPGAGAGVAARAHKPPKRHTTASKHRTLVAQSQLDCVNWSGGAES
jgi:hypothetical protein